MLLFPAVPDYSNSILNVINSVIADYGITPFHPTLPLLDSVLEHGAYRHIALIVCDAMGSMNLDELLPPSAFLLRRRTGIVSSVFPPTTAAATTTYMTGLSPAQHGWIGWSPYFPQIKECVELFPNNILDRLIPAADKKHAHIEHPDTHPDYSVAGKYLQNKTVFDLIEKSGAADTYTFASFLPKENPNHLASFKDAAAAVLKTSAQKQRTYTYCYWPEPDMTMHMTGVTTKDTRDKVETINTVLANLDMQLRAAEKANSIFGKTLVIVSADHGHIDSDNIDINGYQDILDTLEAVPSLEPRAVTFFVKKESRRLFPSLFFSHFSKADFVLLPAEEFLALNLFGPVTNEIPMRNTVTAMCGDFIAISINKKSIFNSAEKSAKHKGMHAGLTEKELSVPLITF